MKLCSYPQKKLLHRFVLPNECSFVDHTQLMMENWCEILVMVGAVIKAQFEHNFIFSRTSNSFPWPQSFLFLVFLVVTFDLGILWSCMPGA